MIDVNRLITKILMYSAINRRANGLLLYSILNPDTISDSPSAKSKGARLVSAKLVMNHIKAKGRNNRAGIVIWNEIIGLNLRYLEGRRKVNRIRVILTSYEIVWATLRSLPRREYLELDVHPAARVGYTENLDTVKNRIILNGGIIWIYG